MDKPQLLCELLEEVGRNDMVLLLRDYIQKKNS